MAVNSEENSVERVGLRAGVAFDVNLKTFSIDDVVIRFGDGVTAVPGVDYNVVLNADFEGFRVTPTASLIAKLNGGAVVVYRELDYLTDFREDDAFVRRRIEREFDKTAMRFQQLHDRIPQSFENEDMPLQDLVRRELGAAWSLVQTPVDYVVLRAVGPVAVQVWFGLTPPATGAEPLTISPRNAPYFFVNGRGRGLYLRSATTERTIVEFNAGRLYFPTDWGSITDPVGYPLQPLPELPPEGGTAGVDLTTAQTVGGVKTFSSSPVVPTPSDATDDQKAANTSWVRRRITFALEALTDIVRTTGNQAVAGIKTFASSPIVPDTDVSNNTGQAVNTKSMRAAIAALGSGGGSGGSSDPNAVKLTGDQSVAGVKSFGSSPLVPDTAVGDQTERAINTRSVRTLINTLIDTVTVKLTGNQTIAGVKSFNANPLVPDTATSDETERAINTRSARALINALLPTGGSSDPNAVKLTGDQSVAGVKTFSANPVVPDTTVSDNTGKAVNTKSMLAAIGELFTWNNLKFVPGVLQNIGGTVAAVGQMYWVSSTEGAISVVNSTAFGRSLLAVAGASAGRTTLGLGTISTQNASAVALTGGTTNGVTVVGVPRYSNTVVTADNPALVRTGFIDVMIDGTTYRMSFYPK